MTFPESSGWFRFVRRITKDCVRGSIQIEVPVQPVWPYEPAGKRSPRFEANEVATSHPRARRSPSPNERGRVMAATPAGERTGAPPFSIAIA